MKVINDYNLYTLYVSECAKRKVKPNLPFLYKLVPGYVVLKTIPECFGEGSIDIEDISDKVEKVKAQFEPESLQNIEENIVLEEEPSKNVSSPNPETKMGRLLSIFKSE